MEVDRPIKHSLGSEPSTQTDRFRREQRDGSFPRQQAALRAEKKSDKFLQKIVRNPVDTTLTHFRMSELLLHCEEQPNKLSGEITAPFSPDLGPLGYLPRLSGRFYALISLLRHNIIHPLR